MIEYKNPLSINRNKVVKILTRSNNDICDVLLAVTFHDENWNWVQKNTFIF